MAKEPAQPPPGRLPPDLDMLSRAGHGHTRWRECPACGSHDLRKPAPDELARQPTPDVVCCGCGVALQLRPGGILAAAR